MNTDTSDRSIVRSFFELNTVDKSPDSRKSFYRMLNRIEDLDSSQNSAIDTILTNVERVLELENIELRHVVICELRLTMAPALRLANSIDRMYRSPKFWNLFYFVKVIPIPESGEESKSSIR